MVGSNERVKAVLYVNKATILIYFDADCSDMSMLITGCLFMRQVWNEQKMCITTFSPFHYFMYFFQKLTANLQAKKDNEESEAREKELEVTDEEMASR